MAGKLEKGRAFGKSLGAVIPRCREGESVASERQPTATAVTTSKGFYSVPVKGNRDLLLSSQKSSYFYYMFADVGSNKSCQNRQLSTNFVCFRSSGD